ncbi:restriction endonuclease subunit S [Campylobacter sp. MIT 21-1685]|uniref:restriction endonuclease subunit S n=1 Tax=unclassified Campylobacter TaxID=2593542 RepID=UPI00224A63B3|nr:MULTISPECIES: restriction endonuclease subunit S [unclassified Campylobacter]MCX2683759.1 restriction endonuclease subunit S [Campylobacter sp. MIT 21-1684]MCX2752043.1 restriction endonuclease subunit S [Campylobacter sp. MIT 21-1682]MCX2808231.1 restriction endonuclease subunit S [Campylobacter sp. MIT 21-1685]
MNKTTWQRVKLEEICSTIDYGYTTSATNLNTGVKFLRITDIVPNIINWDSVPYCEINFDKKEKYLLERGDIVIARTGATTGYNKIIKQNDIQAVFASYLIRYKINLDLANPYFVFYHLQSLAWKGFVEGIIGGSAQPNANAKQFADFSFPLPPLETQQKIAEILSSFDDKIELLHNQNKTLESLAFTLFRHYFIDNPKRNEWEWENWVIM